MQEYATNDNERYLEVDGGMRGSNPLNMRAILPRIYKRKCTWRTAMIRPMTLG